MFVSRCGSKRGGRRDEIVAAIRKHVKVFSFGKCNPTANIETEHPECARKPRYAQKMCVFQKYRVVLTLDNSENLDYVTEKVYHGLLSGAVPICFGAPNIDNFLPMHSSAIHVRDFSTLDDLGKHLSSVVAAEELPREHGEWRVNGEKGIRAVWGQTFVKNLLHPEPTCDICRMVANRKCV
eukprot:PhF_6_TR41028/c0_g1_i1/m.62141